MSKSKPEVFIIESLTLADEKRNCPEGRRIADMIALSGPSGKRCKYFYIRTQLEFAKILQIFKRSRYRYLHLSCHGEEGVGLWTTFERMSFGQVSELLCPYIDKKRVFLSACKAADLNFATKLMKRTNCISVMAPTENIEFSDAALFWSSFYHLMFKQDHERMNNKEVIEIASQVAHLFGISLNHYGKNGDGATVCTPLGI
jgi:hypothetical protein